MEIRMRVTCLIVLLWTIVAADPQKPNLDAILNRRTDVYIAGFFPFGKGVENSNTGRGVMPSVKLALDHVNEHDAVLRNYRLHMWWNDTECNAAVGVKSFFDMMHSGPHKLMLFGAACTHVTDPIAKASKHWHLTQLSYADTHPMFTKEAFPNFFRIVPSENAFNMPRIRLLQHFNWTRVGTIYQNEPRYALAHNRLVADLDMNGFEVEETQSFATEVRTALTKLKEKDVRIILGNFNETWALKIFCEAYNLDMYGRAYTWVVLGTYRSHWWDGAAPCPKSQLLSSLDGALLTDLLPLSSTGQPTVSGITAKDYQIEYDRRRGSEYSRFHGYTYDGIWAMALAIQTVAQQVKLKHKEKTVQDFKYRDKEWEQLFLEALSNVTFEGVTGPVRFYDNERRASILLKQFQREIGEVKVGEYCAERDLLDLTSWEPFKWIGKNPPKDRTLRLIEHAQVNVTIYAVLVFCSCLGILLAAGFLAMNIHYRNQRYIKMSSPHLNNLIIVGCMLTYWSVIFLGLDSSLSSIAAFPYICTARAWLLMAGFSLAFGAMFSKTWRVHSIFTDVKLNKKVIKDYQLFMVVGVLLCIDLAIMLTWQIADPFYRETKQMEPYPHPSSEDIVIVQENEYCQSGKMSIFIGVIYAYKGLLLLFGAFLAWETRSVSIPALNDSKHIGLSVYNVLIMCITGAPMALLLADHKDALFIFISVFIIFCTTATLCLVFVPKLLELRRNGQGGPGGTRIRATLRPAASTHECRSPGPELERRMKELRQFNNRYRRTLQAKENELQILLSKLGEAGSTESSKTDSKSPGTQRTRLPVPKDNFSHPETSDITSVCSLTASAGADVEYQNIQNDKKSQQSEPIKEPPPKETKREPTKNVSFKNHLDTSSPPSSKPVLEKDQLAKLPYGWNSEEPIEPKSSLKITEPVKAETKTISALKPADTSSAKSVPTKLQEPMYTKAAPWQETKVLKSPDLPKKPSKPPEQKNGRDQKSTRGHRRMSSVGHGALLSDLMRVSVDQEYLPETNVVGQERDPLTEKPKTDEREDILDSEQDYSSGERRKSVQRRDSERRKKENYIVVQSDLWDTTTFQYTCQKTPPVSAHHHVPMQRSVSEKTRPPTSPHNSDSDTRTLERRASNASINYATNNSRGTTPEGYRESDTPKLQDKLSKRRGSELPTTASNPRPQSRRRQSTAERIDNGWKPDPDTIKVAKGQDSPVKRLRQEAEPLKRSRGVEPKLSQAARPDHHKSSPNVASRQKSAGSPGKPIERNSASYKDTAAQRRMYAASSESELFECAILPIFHKLLTERHKSQPHSLDLGYGLSCPNISIKCDIVEYL